MAGCLDSVDTCDSYRNFCAVSASILGVNNRGVGTH